MKKLFIILLCICLNWSIVAQNPSPTLDIAAIVFMDSLTVTAQKEGFEVEEFIDLVRNDRSFYQAFRNIRFLAYEAENEMIFYDKKGIPKASYQSNTQQYSDGTCRTMEVLEESVEGNFYKKNKKYRYYTTKMFDRVFFTEGKICESKEATEVPAPKKGIRKHISELKKLIFQPGEKVDVPIIGKKTAIFEPEMAPYYDYTISSKPFKDQTDCYVFSAKVKPAFQEKKVDKTVIKYLDTYFDKSTFQVVGRKYLLAYRGTLFDFEVEMEIDLMQFEEGYVPKRIRYKGFWDIPTKRKEDGEFTINFSNYKSHKLSR